MTSRGFRSSLECKSLVSFAAASLLLVGAAVAAPVPVEGGAKTYKNCMALANKDPDAALEAAFGWQDMGGGDAARHCVAVALFNLGQFAQAAVRFENLAGVMQTAPKTERARVLAQAGTAWMRAEDLERAHAAQSAALRLAPNDSEILIDRAMTLAGAKNYWEAIDDLNRVLEAQPNRVDALILRASAYRFVDALPLARQDADAAFRLAPERPEVLLEYGILQRLGGDREGARRTWLTLIRLHEGTPAGDAAQRNLELLDVQVER